MSPPELNPSPRVPVLAPGDRLDRYELLCPVARGGMAEVWVGRLMAKHGFEKLFAIKTIRPDFAADAAFQGMFLDEARIASNLVHPNIAQVIDLGEQNGILYIVMDWVVGESLQRMLSELASRKAELPLSIALRVLREIAAGLHYAHELADKDGNPLGIVHRDVSPQNILVTASGHAKLIDFGVAKARDRLGAETGQGIMKGKLDYMSPEQANGDPIDRRADVWSLGAVLYRCLTGTTPYRSDSQVTTLKRLASGDPVPPLPAAVPPAVAEVVHRALQFRREDRYESADAMRVGLEQAIATSRLRVASTEVAAFMKELMAQRMETTREAIKTSIKAVTGAQSGVLFSQLHDSSPGAATPASAPGAPRVSAPAPAPTPSAPTLSGVPEPLPAPAQESVAASSASRRPGRPLVLVGLALAALTFLAVVAFLASNSSPTASEPAAAPVVAAPVPPAPPAELPTAAPAEPPPEPAPPPAAAVEASPAVEPAAPEAVKPAAKKPPRVAKPAAPVPPPVTPATTPVDLGY